MSTKDEKHDYVEGVPESDNETAPWTEAEEATVRRKLDFQIVPLVTFLYLLCFLDRANIGNARILGLERDLELQYGYRFNIATSIFYIIYLTVEVPSNILLKRIGGRFYIPALVVGFGLMSLCTAFVHTFSQLCALRALLGIFEGGAMPGIAFYLSSFYKREELYFRVGIYVSAASMAGAFGGLLAAGLSQIPAWGVASMRIAEWRNIFFFEGLITMIAGCLAPILLPQTPGSSKRLTEREKYIATERLVREFRVHASEQVKPRHVKRAMLNINNYICAAGFFCINISVQGLSVFMPTIIRDLGYTSITAQLYTVPVYVLASLVAIAVSFASDWTGKRGIFLAGFTILGITGFSMLRWGSGTSVKYAAVYLSAIGVFPGGPGFLSWGLNNASGPAIRAVASGWIVTLGTMGGILAVWAYLPNDGPNFPIGHSINLTAQFIVLALSIGGILYCLWENKVRARGGRDHRLTGLTEAEQADLGYRHPEFRYIA
ncbi:major facilitator superfamily domain-containing protein [Microdochium trichocladiopsis]|uniref:Major facilitator superfamily domain-containing protein n=1 Tax=Microdochium trichocladiopsis TaxID=1682393 RepID=A0A9P8YBT1_9PEZI|nr:major facilitator superfamily domain-containing protein [Microdochium trichocladiopsis]KAH7033218.1 major facilitator superfamily domain-containing protein [Microdochium trichocladiopsis]